MWCVVFSLSRTSLAHMKIEYVCTTDTGYMRAWEYTGSEKKTPVMLSTLMIIDTLVSMLSLSPNVKNMYDRNHVPFQYAGA